MSDLDSIIDGVAPTQVASAMPQAIQPGTGSNGQPLASNPLDAEIDGSALHDANQEKFGGLGQQAIAGLEGAGRGATLGLSDLAETKLLGINPESIKGRQEANPVTSTIGNLVGGAGLIGATGGLAAPIEAAALGVDTAAIASEAAAKAVAQGATEAVANSIGQQAAKTAITAASKSAGALGSIGASALGTGVEGAAFGAGNAVSDYALGDPHLNAQKVISDIGMGALLGGALGAGGKALENSGILGKRVADIASRANDSAETSEALSSKLGSTDSSISGGAGSTADSINPDRTDYLKGLNTEKANIGEIKAAAGRLPGVQVTEGMASDNRWVQQAEDALTHGAPTYSAVRRQKIFGKNLDAINSTLHGVLDTGDQYGGGAMTARQLGESLQGSLTAKIGDESAPIEAMYDALKPHMASIDVPTQDLNSLSKEILALPEAKTSFGEGKLAKQVAGDILNLNSVEDLKNYKSALSRSISPTASPGEKHMLGVLADKLSGLEEGSIEAAASSPELPSEVQEQMRGLIEQRKAADAAYKPFRQDLNTLVEQLGKKNAGGKQTAINFIKNDLDPEALANKLFDKKYSKFNDFFAEKFPEEAALLKQYQKQQLKAAASKSGEFSPKVFFNKVNGLEPEIRAGIFSTDELQKIKDASTIYNAIPKNFNPSGTAGALDFKSYFNPSSAISGAAMLLSGHPIGAAAALSGHALANARDFGIEGFIKIMSLLPDGVRGNPFEVGAEAADKFNKMSAIQKLSQNVDNQIQGASKSIFGVKDAVRGAALSGATLGADKGYDTIVKDVKNLADNPSGIVDHLAAQTGDLHNALPNVTQGLHNTMMAGLSFLNSKIPGNNSSQLPYAHTYAPSQLEKQKFMQYYSAVNDPVGVLKDVKDGTLTNHQMEALQAVHPHLLKQMQTQIAGDLKGTEDKEIPYSRRIALAKFLNTPLGPSMHPQAIMANQMALSGPELSQQGAVKQSRGAHSLGKLNLAGRSATKTNEPQDDG